MREYRVYILDKPYNGRNVLVTDNDNKLVFPSSDVGYRVTESFSAGDFEKLRAKLTNGGTADLNEDELNEDEFYKPGTQIEVKEDSPIKNVPFGVSPQIRIRETTTINDDQLSQLIDGYARTLRDYETRLGQIDTRYKTEINKAEDAVIKAEDALKKLQKSLREEKDQLPTPGQTLEEIIDKLK